MTPFFITIATACFSMLGDRLMLLSPGISTDEMYCIERVVAKSTYPVIAKMGETVYRAFPSTGNIGMWLDEFKELCGEINDRLSPLALVEFGTDAPKAIEPFYEKADRTFCARYGHVWQGIFAFTTHETFYTEPPELEDQQRCAVCKRKRRKVTTKTEKWIEEEKE